MKIHFYGGANVVTGANYLIDCGLDQIMVDCGAFQGPPELNELNYTAFPYEPSKVNYVFITHSHLDHCGRLPKLVKDGFRGTIICTPPTRDLIKVCLADAVHVMEEEAQQEGKEPLFNENDLALTLSLIKTYDYGRQVKLNSNIQFRLQEAGHILGSSLIELWLKENKQEKKITFTGDLGNPPTPLLQAPAKIEESDYLVIESAYGDRLHESRKQRKILLQQAILDTVKQKAVLMIPSFALERTQELLYELNDLVENKKIPPIPIFIDSPLAIKVTEVYKQYKSYFNQQTRYIISTGDDIFSFPGLKFTPTKQESKDILLVPPPKIIIAGAGMSTGGRILFHEKEYLDKSNNIFLVIGFQVEGTLGRKILNKEPVVQVLGSLMKNRAEIRAIGGYSAHADQQQLFNFINNFKQPAPKVFIVQGEAGPANALKKLVEQKLKISAVVPHYEDSFDL